MASRTRVVRYSDFSGGEYGDLGGSSAETPPSSFTAKNVMRYRTGLLGPRPGIKALAPTGVPTGTLWGLRGLGPDTTNGVVFGIGTTVYGFTYSSPGAVATLGTVGSTPSDAQIIQHGTLGYVAVSGTGVYKIDPAGSVTLLSSSPGASTLAVYGDRLTAANVTANPNRVYYTDAADFTTWPALNYFDVSADQWDITFMEESRSRLAIANTGQEWWSESGVPGVNDTLKRTPRGDLGPQHWHNCARVGESIYFTPYGDDFPVQFTGAVTDKLRYQHLRFTGGSDSAVIGAASLPGSDTLCFVDAGGTNRMLVEHNNTWTFHTLGITPAKLVSPVSHGEVNFRENALLLTDGGGPSSAPTFYQWVPDLERPGKTGDTNAAPGDNTTTPLDAYVYFPEWWTEDNSEAIVRAVRVDFAKWNTGSSSTNHFDLAVRALHRYNQDSTRDSTTKDFDEATSDTSADETLDSRTFQVGDQGAGHGFSLRFSNLRGVAIRRVLVSVDLDPPRI